MIELKNIQSPEDLNNLTTRDLNDLAVQIRSFLLDNVSSTGGHLSSNLGVVELTLALHKVFDSPNDKILWDVGHQGYVHKILTGRQEDFKTLRQYQGMSGFLKASESEHDVFDAGHSSTSISAALGYAKAFKMKGLDHRAIAVIGDGALTGGMAFEALNYAGHSDENLIVVLNDNEMSISSNVGAITTILSKARTTTTYDHFKLKLIKILRMIPLLGKGTEKILRTLKNSVKQIFVKGMLFEEFGFKYVGVIDGHDVSKMVDVLEHIKGVQGPVLLHVSTTKGKGYHFAEKEPDKYHGVGKFNIEDGIKSTKVLKYQDVMGNTLIDLAKHHSNVVGITAAMPTGTGLTEFSKVCKDQFVDVGIAEQNAVTMAAGLAKGGMKPYVCIYSTFLQRAYDQIVHDVCLQNLDVVFCIDRAGLVGEDGETHHGMFDISYLSHIPNMTILAPKDGNELVQMMNYSYTHSGPIAIRYPRGSAIEINKTEFSLEPEILSQGEILILAVGSMVKTALDAVEQLKSQGVTCELVNPRQLIPMKASLLEKVKQAEYVVTIEDQTVIGGYGHYVSHISNKSVCKLGLPNEFVEHGAVGTLHKVHGLDKDGIVSSVLGLRR